MGALGVVEQERPRERLEDGVGDSACVATLEPRVVVDAHACEQRHLFSTETGNATRAGAVGAQSGLLGRDPPAPGAQELPHLALGVHEVESSPGPHTLRGLAGTWFSGAGQAARTHA